MFRIFIAAQICIVIMLFIMSKALAQTPIPHGGKSASTVLKMGATLIRNCDGILHNNGIDKIKELCYSEENSCCHLIQEYKILDDGSTHFTGFSTIEQIYEVNSPTVFE